MNKIYSEYQSTQRLLERFQTDNFEVALWLANTRSVVTSLAQSTFLPESIWTPSSNLPTCDRLNFSDLNCLGAYWRTFIAKRIPPAMIRFFTTNPTMIQTRDPLTALIRHKYIFLEIGLSVDPWLRRSICNLWSLQERIHAGSQSSRRENWKQNRRTGRQLPKISLALNFRYLNCAHG